MANDDHLKLLKAGTKTWNEWRKNNLEITPDFRAADLRLIDLHGANLDGADFHSANLMGTWFKKANLRGTYFGWANLAGAIFIEAELNEAKFIKANLIGAKFMGASLAKSQFNGAELEGADFYGANLRDADFTAARLYGANLKDADLCGANLICSDARKVNFTAARLTGICLEDWHINSTTVLDRIDCEYVYLKSGQQERSPSSGKFIPGEFIKLVEKVLGTVDLIFLDGIDWTAFLVSLNELKTKYGEDNLAVQAIERKSGGSFVIRLEVPPDVNKGQIECQAKEYYENNLKLLETRYRQELKAKDEQIILYRQHNTSLEKMIDVLGNRPMQNIINVTAQSESKCMSESNQFSVGGSVGSNVNNVQGDKNRVVQGDTVMTGDRNINTGGGNYNERIQGDYVQGNKYAGQPQSLAEAAAEIQALLRQLEQTYPTATTSEKMVVAAQAVDQIETNPLLKQRVINAIKEGSLAAFEKAIDNPVGAFVVHAIEGWQEVK